MKRRVLVEILILTIIAVSAYELLGLYLPGCGVVWGIGILLLPWLEHCLRRNSQAKKEYYELTAYMEQMLCSYKREGNIRLALEDCATLFPEKSKMGKLLGKMLHMLKTGEGVEGAEIVQETLQQMNEGYNSRRLILLHNFLCSVDKMGGETAEALDILLQDLQMWKRRVLLYQQKKHSIRVESVVAALLALLMCFVSRIFVPFDFLPNLTGSYLYQGSTALIISLLFFVEVFILHKLTGSWLDTKHDLQKKEKRQLIQQYMRLKKTSDGNNGAGIFAHLAKKICRSEVEREFPYWLLSVTLYLQQKSVYHAVSQSLQQVRGIFREEVKKFLNHMYESPASLLPFTDFFQELELSEVQTGMKILYSVNTNGYQETRKQVRFLVEQNNLVMDKCERNRLENQIAGMGLLKQIPLTLACGKVVVDMVVLLMMLLRGYQSIF
ncbi:MAG: hypothetical protein J1F22_04780 [Lachnospiraceae bacterium]|nr:hypothetical protein [Lachnospiraceae bacterium]